MKISDKKYEGSAQEIKSQSAYRKALADTARREKQYLVFNRAILAEQKRQTIAMERIARAVR